VCNYIFTCAINEYILGRLCSDARDPIRWSLHPVCPNSKTRSQEPLNTADEILHCTVFTSCSESVAEGGGTLHGFHRASWCSERSRYSDSLQGWLSGDRIPVGARFSAPVQTGPGAHSASCAMGAGSFPEVKSDQGVMLTIHPHIVPRLKKEYSSTSTPPLGIRDLL
jgi:hypothetical protein